MSEVQTCLPPPPAIQKFVNFRNFGELFSLALDVSLPNLTILLDFKAFPLVSTDFPELVHIKSFTNKTRENRPIRRVVIRSRLFTQAVIWKFVSVVVWSALLTLFKSIVIGLTFVFSTLSLKVVGNSVIAATLTLLTVYQVPGFFSRAASRATSGEKLKRVSIQKP